MIINNYTIKKSIGQGGMATVYLAHDNKFNTNVAIKVLNKEFVNNENIRKRFIAEARNMFKMSHPNIIKVTDLIDEGDTVAFVMEYVEGETLKEYLDRKGKLSDAEIKNLFSQMLEAVGYVHEQNLVHRDIKPSNFMITPKGQIKLLDFGIAKNTDTNSADYTQTGTSQNMGTPMYMSPEQIKSTKDVTLQSDIYSLGVVLWQMVMGKKPYDINTISTFELQTKIVTEPLSITRTNWDTYILKATAKNEKERYLKCEEWLSEIKVVQNRLIKDDKTILDVSISIDKTIVEKIPKNNVLLEASIFSTNNELKYGFVNLKGDWIIQPKFDNFHLFDEQDYYCAELDEKWGVLDRKGNWIIQPMFEELASIDMQGYCRVKLNLKYGFIDKKGDWIVQPMFDFLFSFDEQGYSIAQLDEKYGYIDRKGNWIIQPMFDSLDLFDEQGYCIAQLDEKYGYIDRKGNWIIQPMSDSFDEFDEQGYCITQLDEKYGYIDRKGNWIIQPIFDSLDSFDEHVYSRAQLDEKYGYIDKKGDWIIQPMFDFLYSFDQQGYCIAQLDEKYGCIDRKGNWIIQPMFDSLDSFDEQGYCSAQLIEKWGFIDRKGNWTIQPIYEYVSSFDELGYCIVKINNKYGCIDRNGNWIIQPIFDNLYSFDVKDYSHAELNEKWGLIDRKGNWILQPIYEKIEGTTVDTIFKVAYENKYGFMDNTWKWVIEPKFDYIETDFWDDEPMIWNDELKKWELQTVSTENSFENFEDEISDLLLELNNRLSDEKCYYGKNIPDNKLNALWSKFSNLFDDQVFFFWYYDDTLFGKGDDGIAIIKTTDDKWFLLVAAYLDTPYAFELIHSDTRLDDSDNDFMKLDLINSEGNKDIFIERGVEYKSGSMSVLVYEENELKYLHLKIAKREVINALSDCWDNFPGNVDEEEDEDDDEDEDDFL